MDDTQTTAGREWLEAFFDPLFFNARTCLTTDPTSRELTPSDHPLVSVVALGGGAPRVPPRGLILAPFHLPRLLNDPDLGPPALAAVHGLADQVRARLRKAHGESAVLRHVIWAGMGGSIEDKNAILAGRLVAEPDSPNVPTAGLVPEPRVQLWTLDDVNADSLAHILAAIGAGARARSGAPPAAEPAGGDGGVDAALVAGLKETVVIAQALGMTSFEPAFNVQQSLAPLFSRCGLPLDAHFCKVRAAGRARRPRTARAGVQRTRAVVASLGSRAPAWWARFMCGAAVHFAGEFWASGESVPSSHSPASAGPPTSCPPSGTCRSDSPSPAPCNHRAAHPRTPSLRRSTGHAARAAAMGHLQVTIPGSILDTTLSAPIVSLPHQPGPAGGQSSAAGRHDFVTHGMLLPLALAGAPLEPYVRGLQLRAEDAAAVLRIAAWIDAASTVGGGQRRRQAALVLRLPAEWCGRWHARRVGGGAPGGEGAADGGSESVEWRDGSLWFKQMLEESLGKLPSALLKVVTSPHAPTDPATQIVLILRAPSGPASGGEDDEAALAAQGYGVLTHTLPSESATARGPAGSVGATAVGEGVAGIGAAADGLAVGGAGAGELGPASLAHACALFTALAYRLAQMWGLCAVDQPPVECYKRIVKLAEEGAGARAEAMRLLGLGGGSLPGIAGGGTVGGTGDREGGAGKPIPSLPLTVAGPAGMVLSLSAAARGGGLDVAQVAAELSRLALDPADMADVLGAVHRVAVRALRGEAAAAGGAAGVAAGERASAGGVVAGGGPGLCYGEIIYFGNLTRGHAAQALRLLFDRLCAADLWACALRSFCDVGKGPGVGHATHAMSKQGGALTISILPEEAEEAPEPRSEAEGASGAGAALAAQALATARDQLAAFPAGYQASHAYANVLALAGYDVDETGTGLVASAGHPGIVLLLTIKRNDEHTRAALARVFSRVEEIVRMRG